MWLLRAMLFSEHKHCIKAHEQSADQTVIATFINDAQCNMVAVVYCVAQA
jgi:hypothetical protein